MLESVVCTINGSFTGGDELDADSCSAADVPLVVCTVAGSAPAPSAAPHVASSSASASAPPLSPPVHAAHYGAHAALTASQALYLSPHYAFHYAPLTFLAAGVRV